MMPITLDRIDRRILAALQRDGRLTNVELAREVGLSPSPCLRRVRLLEEAGVIDRYVALLNAEKIGYGMSVFVRIWLKGQDKDTVQGFIDAVQQLGQIVECHQLAGDCDFLLRVVAENLEAYRRFQSEHLARIAGISSLKTDIPLLNVKSRTELPVLPG
ncbi:Lrp/AsnC family transcriptional regulator [Croceibacterium xixiisoli]|uniref:Lrp/AsnC family transcriptional regulator n=1 Tax=Croceibacterium xixiisoli TaxID=1476466 RepID=UPI001F3BC794|nr:Lrp/AsnC family transcriptional regulator [Croceibacterium xixiisoli]